MQKDAFNEPAVNDELSDFVIEPFDIFNHEEKKVSIDFSSFLPLPSFPALNKTIEITFQNEKKKT